jgi:hypothetical protein
MTDPRALDPKPTANHIKWKSPAGVGIFAAIFGLFAHLAVAWYSDRNVRELGAAKMQSELILKAVNAPTLQQSCQNLIFFINTSLLQDPDGKINQECTHPLQQTYIPAFAALPQNPPVAQDMGITVKKVPGGDSDAFQVAFTVPNEPNAVFNTVKIYCTQMSGTRRLQEKLYPSQQGNWKPGDRVSFSVTVPKALADASAGWNLTFCVGTESACYPSPNLLIGTS